MKQSLFAIESRYQAIIEELENNGGELTDELAEELAITEQDLTNKLDSYRKAMQILEGEQDTIKVEIERLRGISKTKDNTIKRLKTSALDAVLRFGDVGKSGNKTIVLPDCKFFTVNTKSVQLDENKINLLGEIFVSILSDLYDNGMLDRDTFIGDGYTNTDLVNRINEVYLERTGDQDFKYTVDDLYCVEITYSVDIIPYQLLSNPSVIDVIKCYLDTKDNATLTTSISKSTAKSYIENPNIDFNLGEIVVEPSLRIK